MPKLKKLENFLREGIVPVYKPVGFSTFDLIRCLKRQVSLKKKVGHGGTLDPFAEGLVLLLFGKATKKFEEIKKWPKVYVGSLRLGWSSDSFDIAGGFKKGKCPDFSEKDLLEIIPSFEGEIIQRVPSFSAAKLKGVPLYKLARKGILVEKQKKVKVEKIELIAFRWPIITLRFKVSGGTYIRTLAIDIFKKLNCDSLLFSLKRETIGNYKLEESFEIKDLISFFKS